MPGEPPPEPFPAPLSNEAAWAQLPPAIKGQGSPLPIWARQLAQFMPKTTASLLSLDYAQRVRSPIPPNIRASMRFVTAITNRSPFARLIAEYDQQVAASAPRTSKSFTYPEFVSPTLAADEAGRFALQMARHSSTVTDDEFNSLIEYFGKEIVASMVLLCAYSNMMDRLFICISSHAKEAGALAPVEVEFAPESFVAQTTPPPSRIAEVHIECRDSVVEVGKNWSAVSFDQLQQKLENQRQKPTRLPIPDWETCAKNLPPGLINKPSDIAWYRIVFGYAPELAIPFEYFMRTSMSEGSGKLDRIFATSLFWVTTKAIDCPYCMGHCEMNFEVAGLNREEIEHRSRILGSDDWSGFPPREQRAFALAHKLTLPHKVTQEEIVQLRQDFGDETALIIMLNACRYHYMTRISNGFQLTLERENVFFDYYNVKAGR